MLVTGGRAFSGGWNFLDSTELLRGKTSIWTFSASLPSGRFGLRAASVANTVFVFGKNQRQISKCSQSVSLYDFVRELQNLLNIRLNSGGRAGRERLASILRYNVTENSWEEAGEMEAGRNYHQVATLRDVSSLCP